MDHRFRLLDDDGLIAVVARNAFAREFSRRAFDYQFPRELVLAVRSRWGVPAPTAGGGGVVEVHLRANADGDAGAPRHTWQLDLELEDCLMVVPYSQFALRMAEESSKASTACRSGFRVSTRARMT